VVAVAGLAAPNEIPAGFGTVAADVAGVEEFAPKDFHEKQLCKNHEPSVKDGAVVVAAFGVVKDIDGVGKADDAVDAAADAAPRLTPVVASLAPKPNPVEAGTVVVAGADELPPNRPEGLGSDDAVVAAAPKSPPAGLLVEAPKLRLVDTEVVAGAAAPPPKRPPAGLGRAEAPPPPKSPPMDAVVAGAVVEDVPPRLKQPVAGVEEAAGAAPPKLNPLLAGLLAPPPKLNPDILKRRELVIERKYLIFFSTCMSPQHNVEHDWAAGDKLKY